MNWIAGQDTARPKACRGGAAVLGCFGSVAEPGCTEDSARDFRTSACCLRRFTDRSLLLCLSAIVSCLFAAGCNDNAGVPDTDRTDSDGETRREPIWEEWDKPELALMLTSEMHGYFEPCGCTANQLGGMTRRADLYKKLTNAGWEVRGLDVGGLARRNVRQAQIKFETTLQALRKMNYVAIGLGPEEIRLDPDFLLTLNAIDDPKPPYLLCANAVFYESPDLGTPKPSVVFEAGGMKIGVTSVLSKQLQSEVLPHPVVTSMDPAAVLGGVLKDFEAKQVDLRILLSQGTVEESEELVGKYPDFDIVLTAEGVGDPDPREPPKKIGETLLIEAGRKGKYVGVLGVYPESSESRFRYQLVSLDQKDFDDAQSMIDLMQEYQTRLQDDESVRQDLISAPHPSGSKFVGADKCGECHTSAYAKWKETPHSHALESLDPKHQRPGHERLNGVNRTFDPECLACHVTGWDPNEYIRFESGFMNRQFAESDDEKTLHDLMSGSQCENCHGPGSQHIELIEAGESKRAREMVRVTQEQARKGMCERCHDPDNSPKFDFDTYWPKVEHPGLD